MRVKVKRFYGENVPDILSRVKSEMGSDAVIIQSRKCRRGGLLGIFQSPMVEIIAAVDNDHRRYFVERERPRPAQQAPQPPAPDNSIAKEITELKKIIEGRMPAPLYNRVYPGSFQQIFQILLNNDVDEKVAKDVVDRALHQIDQSRWQDIAQLKAGAAEIISGCLHISGQEPLEGKGRIAMIGPTGVGKTTTIAKLAAITSVLKEKSVALITIDTFRVGAVDQLKTYADIISVPLDVARTPKELKDLLDKHRKRDLVLIDTAGRSPFNKLQIAETRGFLEACPELKVYLVLNVATNQKDLNEIIQRYSKFSIDKLIFTKLDETQRYGAILNTASTLKKELAYVTTGQNVPDDIEIPAPLHMAQLILREGPVEGHSGDSGRDAREALILREGSN
jgi:flagellar biosynthesis protein FlhF